MLQFQIKRISFDLYRTAPIGKIIAFSNGLRNLEFDRQYRLDAMCEFIKNLPKGVLIDKKQLGT